MRRTLDLSYAKNALFVRQSAAVAFGIPLDRELTWDFLEDQICHALHADLPDCLEIRGFPSPHGALGAESRNLSALLQALQAKYDLKVQIVLHD